MPEEWLAVAPKTHGVKGEEVPFLGTEAGLFSLILPCIALLVALGNILKGDDG